VAPAFDAYEANAMALECLSLEAERLVIATPEERAAQSSREDRRHRTELQLWRWGTAVVAALVASFNVPELGLTLATISGNPPPPPAALQPLFGLCIGAAAFAVVEGSLSIARIHRRLESQTLERAAEILIPLAVAAVAAVVYRPA
jgi:hypothetical protein